MVTAGLIHYVLNMLHITVHIRDVCVFLAPVFSGLTAISTFLLTRELWNQGAGLLAACFIAIVPGYISRSVAGSFDNEGIAIFALQFTYYLWVCTENNPTVNFIYEKCWWPAPGSVMAEKLVKPASTIRAQLFVSFKYQSLCSQKICSIFNLTWPLMFNYLSRTLKGTVGIYVHH